MLGNWKNFEELEDSLSLDELHVAVKAQRAKEERHNRFMAAIKGINLDEDGDTMTAEEKVEEMKRRAEAKRAGKSDDEFEFDELGLDIEVEE